MYERFFASVVSSLPTESYLPSLFDVQVRVDFERLFLLLTPKRSAAAIRQWHLKQFWPALRALESTSTCWKCMVRAPEHMLHSGHGLCDSCVTESPTSVEGVYSYTLTTCPVCGHHQQTTIRIKPWTVEPNVLAIDGGGIKGIVALVLLRRLAAALGSDVDQYFEYVAGTSAGGPFPISCCHIINLTENRWSDRA